MEHVARPYGIFASAFLMDLAVACVGLSMQFLGVSMGASPRVLGMLGALGAGGYALVCVFSGRIADRIGRKRSAIVGVFMTSVVWTLYTIAPNPYWLLAMVPFQGAFLGMVWPAVQAWLADRTAGNQRALNRNLGLFNMSWCTGLLLGPPLAGILWNDAHPSLPFYLCVGVNVVAVVVLLLTAGGGPGLAKPAQASATGAEAVDCHQLWPVFMKLAWLGNFASWFAGSAVGTMFPKLGLSAELGLTHAQVSYIVFAYWAALFTSFFLARTTQRWQFRLVPLIVAEVLSLSVMGAAALFARSGVGFALCFAGAGICSGVTYVSSLFYSINGPSESCARRAGYHEAVLGAGSTIGGLLMGEIAMHLGLRSPYMTVACVFAVVLIVQGIVWARRGRTVGIAVAATH